MRTFTRLVAGRRIHGDAPARRGAACSNRTLSFRTAGSRALAGRRPRSAPRLCPAKPFDWSSTHGHVVVLDFWASWCVPCNAEQPELNKSRPSGLPKGVVFLGVDVQDTNVNGPRTSATSTFRIRASTTPSEVIASEYNVPAPPTVIIIDTKGNIVDHFLGTLTGLSTDLTRLTCMTQITVYGAPWCPDCKRAKKFLGEQRVPYDWVDIDQDAAGLAHVEELQKGGRIDPDDRLRRRRTCSSTRPTRSWRASSG